MADQPTMSDPDRYGRVVAKKLREAEVVPGGAFNVLCNTTAAAVIAASRAEIIAEWVRETGIVGVLLMARTKIEDMRECGDLSHEILEIDKCLARIKAAKE